MKRLFTQNTAIGFWASLAALIGIGALSYENLTRYQEAARWSAHTQAVLVNAETLNSSLSAAEAEQRGFLLTSNPVYLDAYRRAAARIEQIIPTLKQATIDNPSQQQRLGQLEPLIQQRLGLMQQTIFLMQANRSPAAIAIIKSNQGKQLTDQIRARVEELKTEENQLLQVRSRSEQQRLNAIAALTIPGCLGVALFLEITVWHLRQNLRQRLEAEKTLQQQNEKLQLLYEMTRDLLSAEDPIALLDGIYEKLSAQLSLDFYFNYLVDSKEGQSRLRLVSHHGLSQQQAEDFAWLDFGEAACGRVVNEGQQIVLCDQQMSTFTPATLLQSMGILAYSGQPLIAQGQVLGVLSFASRSRTAFSPEEVGMMQAAADQVAIALSRANLLRSLQDRSEQLADMNRVKDEFLAVLSHELRTPLNPILGWTQLLRNRNFDQAGMERALEIIERNAKAQIHLIDDLLDVSRILKGKLALKTQPVNLETTIDDAIETVRLAAEAKAIQLNYYCQDCFADAPCLVLGDANRLQQIVWNLLSNAVKFTPNHGHVVIELSRLDATQLDGKFALVNSIAQIVVSDTGKGIAPEFLPHVFEYFQQAETGTTRKFGGLGLGLAIVRHLVELHGGTIQAESEGEGKGAVFTVQLPLLQAKNEPLRNPRESIRKFELGSP
jgi:signal transduction histidine kinase/CHASE3 domain sensor protein